MPISEQEIKDRCKDIQTLSSALVGLMENPATMHLNFEEPIGNRDTTNCTPGGMVNPHYPIRCDGVYDKPTFAAGMRTLSELVDQLNDKLD